MASTAFIPDVTAVKTIKVQGGNLFKIAAQLLGDAEQWYRIASLNGLNDFMLPPNVIISLKIPAVNPSISNGGILGV
jgi:hypothetical protein